MNDTGLYVCVATSAGVFGVETVTYINVKDPPRGRILKTLLQRVDLGCSLCVT